MRSTLLLYFSFAAAFRTAADINTTAADINTAELATDALLSALQCDISLLTFAGGSSQLSATAAHSQHASSTEDPYHKTTHVVVSLPSALLLTEATLQKGVLAHFLAHPEFRKLLADKQLQLPQYFTFALFVLYQQHSRGQKHGDTVWRAWTDYHAHARTGEHALSFWSSEELSALEEPRMTQSADVLRNAITEQYVALVEPLVSLFPAFFPPDRITLPGYMRAFAVVAAQATHVDGIDSLAILPLPLGEGPSSNVRWEEVVEERVQSSGEVRERKLINLVTLDGHPLRKGALPILDRGRHNDILLLETGRVWPEMAGAAVPIRPSHLVLSYPILPHLTTSYPIPSYLILCLPIPPAPPRLWLGTPKPPAERRRRLLTRAGLNETFEATLTTGKLPPQLILWGARATWQLLCCVIGY